MNFFFRNPTYCVTNPRKSYITTKAMKVYRDANPVCEYDGKRTGVHVHHIVPIRYAPELAAEPTNFISLCPKCHHVVGHGRNWKQYVENVREICESAKIVGDQH